MEEGGAVHQCSGEWGGGGEGERGKGGGGGKGERGEQGRGSQVIPGVAGREEGLCTRRAGRRGTGLTAAAWNCSEEQIVQPVCMQRRCLCLHGMHARCLGTLSCVDGRPCLWYLLWYSLVEDEATCSYQESGRRSKTCSPRHQSPRPTLLHTPAGPYPAARPAFRRGYLHPPPPWAAW